MPTDPTEAGAPDAGHDRVARWLSALAERHGAAFTRPELLKAIRALSARYVERRSTLARRSPVDSAGKRAAFATFYAPMHFLTVQAIVRSLRHPLPRVDAIVDCGCGTGVASAAWALAYETPPLIRGIDLNAWAMGEARWNWRTLGLSGKAMKTDFARAKVGVREGVICAWSLNELEPVAREAFQSSVLTLAGSGAPILIIEPIATRLVPWWPDWASRAVAAGGSAEEWRFDTPLPPLLADLDEAAGFKREELTAKSVRFNIG